MIAPSNAASPMTWPMLTARHQAERHGESGGVFEPVSITSLFCTTSTAAGRDSRPSKAGG